MKAHLHSQPQGKGNKIKLSHRLAAKLIDIRDCRVDSAQIRSRCRRGQEEVRKVVKEVDKKYTMSVAIEIILSELYLFCFCTTAVE